MSQRPSLTYENLAASSGRLASLLSANGSDCSSNEYYEEVAFRNGVASKTARGSAPKHSEQTEATEDQDDDQVGSFLQVQNTLGGEDFRLGCL